MEDVSMKGLYFPVASLEEKSNVEETPLLLYSQMALAAGGGVALHRRSLKNLGHIPRKGIAPMWGVPT